MKARLFLYSVNPAIAKQVLKREPKQWKYNSQVSVNWNPTVLNFPNNEEISLHLYTIRVRCTHLRIFLIATSITHL